MNLHPRYFIVREAANEISLLTLKARVSTEEIVQEIGYVLLRSTALCPLGRAINEIAERHDLTRAEFIQILAAELSLIAKYAIRSERHPDDPNQPGDCE